MEKIGLFNFNNNRRLKNNKVNEHTLLSQKKDIIISKNLNIINNKTRTYVKNNFPINLYNNLNIKPYEKLNLIKDIIKLPLSFNNLINLLEESEISLINKANNLRCSNEDKKNIDIEQLAKIFCKKVKLAKEETLKLISENSKLGLDKNETLSEVFKILSALYSSSSENYAQNIIKNIMLLYLPWFPLGVGNDFKLEFDEDKNSADDNCVSTITILISTISFGNIKIVLNKNLSTNNVFVYFVCCDNFPKDIILKQITTFGKTLKLLCDTEFNTQINNNQKNIPKKQDFNISSSKEIDFSLLQLAYYLIRTIIGMDKKYELESLRLKKIDSNEL